MSQPPKRKADTDASGAAVPKRIFPRPFHAGPNPVADADGGQEHKDEAEHAAASSPVRQVDVSLRCVFGWLHLAELSRVLAVCKQWHADVCAMPPIGARVEIDAVRRPLSAVCASPLAHHVSSLHLETKSTSASAADLALLSARMPALRTLVLSLAMPAVAVGPALLGFPHRLSKLNLYLDWRDASAHTPRASLLHRLLSGIGALASLEELTLDVQMTNPAQRAEVSFEPLRALHRLSKFTFSWLGVDEDEDEAPQQTLSATQLDCLRSLSNSHALRSLSLFGGDIDRLLDDMAYRQETEPLLVHELDVDRTSVAAVHAPALCCFSSLRSFAPCNIEVLDVDFLASMPHLHTLDVSLPEGSAVTPEQLIQSIQPLTHITDLRIDDHPTFNEEHLTRMLAPLTLLRSLHIGHLPLLRSLSFVSSGPITRSLTSFMLAGCAHADLRTVSLLHLHACKQLTSLMFSVAFSDELSEFARAFYTQRPCLGLPALQHFHFLQ